jgi:hypothetical protein
LPLPSAPDPVDSPAADAAAGPNASTTNEAPERIGRSSEGSAKVTETREVANLGNRFLADESGSGTPPHAGPNDTNPKDTGPPEHANGNGPPPHAGPNDTNPKDTGPPDHGSGDGTPPHAGPQDTNTGDSSPPGRAKGIEPLQAPSEDDARSQGNGQLGMTPDTA